MSNNIKPFKDLKEMLKNIEKDFSDEIAFKVKYHDEIVGIKYSKLIEDVKGLGTYLTSLDLNNKRIALISSNRYEWCVTYLAVTTANYIIVPLDKSLPENEFISLLERSEAEVLFYEDKNKDSIEKIKQNSNCKVNHYINLDFELNDVIEKGKRLLKKGDKKYIDAKIEREKMKFMIFTSGTTSMAKCVMLSHKNICSNLEDITKSLDLNSKDTLLSILPLHHTFECTAGFLYAISVGAKISYCEGLRHIPNNLKEYEVTAMISVPLLYESMYKKIWQNINSTKKEMQVKVALKASEAMLRVGIDVRKIVFKQIHEALGGKIRLLVSGAAAIDPVIAKGYNDFGFTLFQGYGLTETSPVLSVENYENKKVGSVGKAFKNAEIKIESPNEDGIGEIIVKAPYVMLGYYNNEQATKESIIHGWLHTGDLGRIDEEGYIFITGRKKNVIVLKNGKNIFPEEIETLINKIEFVIENIVYGFKDMNGDVEVRAKIVYDKDELTQKLGIISDEELNKIFWGKVKEINKLMPTYKYIKDIIVTDEELVKTTTKKIKRHEEIKKIMGVKE
jgi:long-chain acyl-CoA synthetase